MWEEMLPEQAKDKMKRTSSKKRTIIQIVNYTKRQNSLFNVGIQMTSCRSCPGFHSNHANIGSANGDKGDEGDEEPINNFITEFQINGNVWPASWLILKELMISILLMKYSETFELGGQFHVDVALQRILIKYQLLNI